MQPTAITPIKIRDTLFRWGERTYLMGIINLSPDSFSGDGIGANIDEALAQARRFVDEGADILDVGGESTRPGTLPTSDIQAELDLVIPVIERLVRELPVPISVDTYKARVAAEALKTGASLINDIWGLKHDPLMPALAAHAGVPVILMSNQREKPSEGDIIADVIADLKASLVIAVAAGVRESNIILDPGVGFGKKLAQNLEILRRLAELKVLGRPILLATSRKSMIGLVLNLPADQRIEGTAATVAIGIAHGADIVRVHDVREMARVARMSDAVIRGRHIG